MRESKPSLLRYLGLLLAGVLIVCCLLVGIRVGLGPGLLAGFNVSTDPFGVFGDRHLQWWSYNETQNPKVAKFHYLKQHHDEFDSYVIGGPEASAYSVEQLNDYFDARFYNLAMYDADMRVSEKYCRYLIEHYDVKNIVLNVSLASGMHKESGKDAFADAMPYRLSDESAFEYYKRYLFADPQYGQEKLECRSQNDYLRQHFEVFDAETGSFDTEKEDSVQISELSSYMQAHPTFTTDITERYTLAETERCMEHIAAIRDLCDENKVNLIVIASPLYQGTVGCFNQEEVADFYAKLAKVTPYWDFSLSSVSGDPRYFYDRMHFRQSVGKMVLARIAEVPSVYVPDDFGIYVKKGQNGRDLSSYWQGVPATEASYTKKVPILMYHHLIESGVPDNWDIMTVAQFRAQIEAMSQAGYSAVTFDDLRRYVNEGVELPEKSVVITFDDGYESNYTLAKPILEEYNMKATIFVIGDIVGQKTYKDTGISVAPYVSWEKAKEMEDSGVIDIESHGYDIHDVLGLDDYPIREGCLPLEGESQEDYINFLEKDCETMRTLFEEHLDKVPTVLAYPYGKYTDLSETVFSDEGYDITLSVEEGNSLLIKGMPQSLKAMKRHFVKGETTPEALLTMMQG